MSRLQLRALCPSSHPCWRLAGETLAARGIKDLALLPALSTLLVGGEASQFTCKHLIGDVGLLREAQRPVFLKFAERHLWHTKGLEEVVSIQVKLDARSPPLLVTYGITDEREVLENGFSTSVYVDVCALRTMGLVSENSLKKRTLGGNARAAASNLSHNLEALSPRLRSLLRPLQGSQAKHGPAMYDALRAYRTFQKAVQKSASSLEKVNALAEKLENAIAGGAEHVYSSGFDIVNDDKGMPLEFVAALGGAVRQGDDETDAACVQSACALWRAAGGRGASIIGAGPLSVRLLARGLLPDVAVFVESNSAAARRSCRRIFRPRSVGRRGEGGR